MYKMLPLIEYLIRMIRMCSSVVWGGAKKGLRLDKQFLSRRIPIPAIFTKL